eukprot:Gb_25630 [translate_table: standard]
MVSSLPSVTISRPDHLFSFSTRCLFHPSPVFIEFESIASLPCSPFSLPVLVSSAPSHSALACLLCWRRIFLSRLLARHVVSQHLRLHYALHVGHPPIFACHQIAWRVHYFVGHHHLLCPVDQYVLHHLCTKLSNAAFFSSIIGHCDLDTPFFVAPRLALDWVRATIYRKRKTCVTGFTHPASWVRELGAHPASVSCLTRMRFNVSFMKVIAATNRADILDPALMRSGRLDRKIEFPHPTEDARARILQIHSRKMTVNPDVNYEELARSTDDFNGAQLKAVCVEAGMLALRRDATQVTHEDFNEGIIQVQAKKKASLNYYA